MFKSLGISEFQSHRTTVLDFLSGVNLIIGKSDSGKSAILRAINWCVTNRPLGDGFVRDGADEVTCVRLTTDKGYVERIKDKKENFYSLSEGQMLKPFTAFGSSVPQEITDFLNLSDINIQNQLSPYFLILESSGQIATYLREVCKLDKLDMLYADLNKKITSVNSLIESNKKTVELYSSDWLVSENCQLNLEYLGSLCDKWEEVDNEYKKLGELILDLTKFINQYNQLKIVDIPENLEEGVNLLLDHITTLDVFSKDLNALSRLVSDVGRLQVIDVPEAFGALFEQYDEKNRIGVRYEDDCVKLVDLIKHLTNEDVRYLSNKQNIVGLECRLSKMYESISVCPYCESDLDVDKRNVLIGNIT